MTGTLSSADSAKKIYETGYQGFLLAPSERASSAPLGLAPVDFDHLLAQPQARKLIQALPAQQLYHSLMARGVEDCLEVLPHLSSEQFLRICDYDGWYEDKLAAKRVFTWLGYYRELSPKQMFERFRGLEEEYQLALLTPFIRTYTPEEYEKMTDEQQDSLYRFPADAFFYEITSPDKEIHEGIEQLMDAAMGEDMNYAMAALSHASYQLVGESEAQLQQFRQARLEEDGFVTYEESLELFVPGGWTELERRWQRQPAEPVAAAVVATSTAAGSVFLHKVFAYAQQSGCWDAEKSAIVQQGFLYLSNALCSACHIDSDDSHGLRRLLAHSQGLCSVALELLSGGEVARAAEILGSELPKVLFRAALEVIALLQAVVVDELKAANIPAAAGLDKFWRLHKHGALLDYLDRQFLDVVGFEGVELLKGLFNRLPLVPVAQQHEQQASAVQRLVFAPVQSRSDLQQLNTAVASLLYTLNPQFRVSPANPTAKDALCRIVMKA